MKQATEEFQRLLSIMDELREKCPWDKKQTMESLRYLSIEEVYELGEAILENDFDAIKGELGDLMLHIVFYAKIAKENGLFEMHDVLRSINDKLIERHPHVFGEITVQDDTEVKENWEKIKLRTGKKSVLEGVPSSLPSLVKAYRIQEKARGIGFEWETREQVWEKVLEEIQELKAEEIEPGRDAELEEEFGDLLFAIVNYGRFLNINAENALEKTNRKFLRRFQEMEVMANAEGKQLENMRLNEMDALWNKIKKLEKSRKGNGNNCFA